MNADTYFLAFSRLARRSVLFWGHAVTSGIAPIDDASTPTRPGGGRHRSELPDVNGGIDYFVSSWLFEHRELGRRAQRKYTERREPATRGTCPAQRVEPHLRGLAVLVPPPSSRRPGTALRLIPRRQ